MILYAGEAYDIDGSSGATSADRALFINISDGSDTAAGIIQTPDLAAATWHHVAVIRNSSNEIKVYVNGVNKLFTGTYNSSTYQWEAPRVDVSPQPTVSGAISMHNASADTGIGSRMYDSGSSTTYVPGFADGNIDEFRIAKGAAVWCEDFTPPTAAHTCTNPTSAECAAPSSVTLVHFDGDSSESCTSSVVTTADTGTVTHSTSTGAFAGGYVTYPGTTTDYTTISSSAASGAVDPLYWEGDFTIDFWINFASVAAHEFIMSSGNAAWSGACDGTFAFLRDHVGNLPFGSDPVWDIIVKGPDRHLLFDDDPSEPILASTWYHVAITRDSTGEYKMYVNGTQLSQNANTAANPPTLDCAGANGIEIFDNGAVYGTTDASIILALSPLVGMVPDGNFSLDELRITKGVVVWCENFDTESIIATPAAHTCTAPTAEVCGGGGGGGANPSSEDSGGTTSGTYAISAAGTDYYYWHLEDISKRAVGLTAPTAHTNYHAWNYLYDGENVDLYVIDSGVNSSHPMLQAHTGGSRVQSVPGYAGMDNGSGTDTNEPPTSTSIASGERGHGTYCSLFAGGGVHGMDDPIAHYGPGVAKKLNIWSLRVMSETGSIATSDMLTAINAVIAHNTTGDANYKGVARASIINFSLGLLIPNSSQPTVYEDIQGARSETLPADAIEDALKQAAFGNSGTSTTPINVVIAAGNGFDDGTTEWHGPMEARYNYGRTSQAYPTFDGTGTATFATSNANNDPGQGLTISSGATKQANANSAKELEAAYFTNYGSAVTIFGPGQGLVCPSWDWVPGNPGGPDIGAFQTGLNGTSFSAPITAGLIALRLGAKPSEESIATKAWLIDSTAGGGNADQIDGPGTTSNGLMTPVDVAGVSGGNGPLKFAYYSADVTLVTGTHTLQVGDVIQINGVTETPTSGSAGGVWPSGVTANQVNGWHTITAIGSDNVIFQITGLNPTSNGGDVGGASVQYAKLTGTHEIDDGVMDQGTTLQLIPDSGSNVDIKYAPVSYSNNLYLYNPYQTYTTAWSSIPALTAVTENDVVSLTLTALMTITNSIPGAAPAGSGALNETPFSCTMTFDSGTVPTGLSYNATTGVLSGTVTTAGTYTFTIAAANGYWNAKRQFSMTVGSSGPSWNGALFHFDAESSTGVPVDSGPNSLSASTDQTSNGTPTSYLNTSAGSSPSHFPSESSYYFDGSNDFLNILYPSSLVLDGDWTIDFWIKFDDVTGAHTGGHQFIIDRENDDDSNDTYFPYFRLWYNHTGNTSSGGYGYQWVLSSGADSSSPHPNLGSGMKTMADDTWYHLAITYDSNGSSGIQFFINGELITLHETLASNGFDWGASSDSYSTGISTIRIGDGSENHPDRGKFKGYIEEFRIVKGSAKWTADFSGSFSGNEPGPYDDSTGE